MLKVSVDWKNKILDILNKKRQKIKVQRKKKRRVEDCLMTCSMLANSVLKILHLVLQNI